MEQMFREYSSWRQKLEQIEMKMKSEIEYWKQGCEKAHREIEKLQKENIKVKQDLLEKIKDADCKQKIIEQLQQ